MTKPELECDRRGLKPGIVHFGVGGFHRAHQAVYIDDLLAQGKAKDWAILGVGVMPGDVRMRDALESQDHLYTVVTKHPDGTTTTRTVGSIVDYLFAPDDPEAVLDVLTDPATKIVSLTVTEGGYHVHEVTGELDTSDRALSADLKDPLHPTTVFGYITEALRRRRENGVPPFTVASCDNVPGNGDVARKMITCFARLSNPELGEWMSEEVAFPCSMVDRITPMTTPKDIAALKADHGIEDAWPVVAEPFTQWVVEDKFPAGRPPLEEVGVQVVDDVEPYELMKIRMLNGSHQAMAYLVHLAGFRYSYEVAQDPQFIDILAKYMSEEAAPTVPSAPGIDTEEYQATLLERFANPAVRDTIARLAAETSDRIPKFVLPTILAQLEAGGPIDAGALIIASWARYAEGIDEEGQEIEVVDRRKDEILAAAADKSDPLAFLRNEDLFGDLAQNERFTERYQYYLELLREKGARAALADLLSTPEPSKDEA